MPDQTSKNIYLNDIPREQAWTRFTQALDNVGLGSTFAPEEIGLELALGRITAEPIWARRSSPHYHAAAMDGYALRSSDTEGVSDRKPKLLELDSQCQYVDTGDALPDGYDAVLPVEVVEPVEEKQAIRIFQAVTPWFNVRPLGEDIVTTELVLPAGHTIRAIDLGAIAAAGHARVKVVRKPKVAVIPTGSELVNLDRDPQPGEIPEFNSLILAGQIESWGAEATRWPIVPDELEAIQSNMHEAALNHDLVLVNAGSSAGSEDFTASAVAAMGQLLVHGVAVRPGHPVILGILEIDKPKYGTQKKRYVAVIGVPGYPVSAALTGDLFIQPLLRIWLGQGSYKPPVMEATLTRKLHSTAGDEEHIRVTLGKVAGRWLATPLSRGAGVITSLVRADGLLTLPAGSQGAQAGDRVHVRLLRSNEELNQTILVLGSHDLTLDLMAQYLAQRNRRLSSNNIGSIGGLVALSRREAHLAGSHLLEPETGEYNVSYVRRYLPNTSVTLIALVRREQGLILAPDNPKGILGLKDLQREDIRYINRQRGSGTRLLLDHHLDALGISPQAIRGYEQEEFTHLTVASAIASGKADCGLGIRAAASALGLDFIPLEDERYDLVIPTEYLDTPLLEPILALLRDPDFKRAVESLEGYDASVMGESTSISPD
jgi:putative molybdopterin biosynthesis protein